MSRAARAALGLRARLSSSVHDASGRASALAADQAAGMAGHMPMQIPILVWASAFAQQARSSATSATAARSKWPRIVGSGSSSGSGSTASGAVASARQQPSSSGAAVSAAWRRAQAQAAVAIAEAQRALREAQDAPALRSIIWRLLKRALIAASAGAATGVAVLSVAERVHALPPAAVAPHLTLQDGRRLAYEIRGDPEGPHTVFWIHGSPSCRLEARFMDDDVFRELGIRLVAWDRPGYGQSDPQPQRSFKTFTDDLRQLADHVGAEQFFVAGMSGGGPYTLAAVSHLEPRVLGAVVNCSAASVGDLTRAERKNLRVVYRSYYPTPGLMALLWSDAMRRATSGVLWTVMQVRRWSNDLPMVMPLPGRGAEAIDEAEQASRRKHMLKQQNIAETLRFRTDAAPWAEDLMLILNPWGFDVSELSPQTRASLHLSHGVDDRLVPAMMTEALQRLMPGSHMHLREGGHLDYWWCDAPFQLRLFSEMLASAKTSAAQ